MTEEFMTHNATCRRTSRKATAWIDVDFDVAAHRKHRLDCGSSATCCLNVTCL